MAEFEIVPEPSDYDTLPSSPTMQLLNILEGHIPSFSIVNEDKINNPANIYWKLKENGLLEFNNATASDGIWPGESEDEHYEHHKEIIAAVDAMSDIWLQTTRANPLNIIRNLIIHTVLANEEIAEAIIQSIETDFIPHLESLEKLTDQAIISKQCRQVVFN